MTDSGDHFRAKEIVLEALARPAEQRAAFVTEACGGDGALRAEVMALLGSTPPELDVLATGGMERAARRLGGDTPRNLPERIGPYRILDVLGEGGMGVVYRAEQTEPIRREVAIKLVRRQFLTPSLRARFEVERRTLALMEHPNVARVLEAGEDDDGNPFLAMELVHGEPITRFCSSRGLGRKERLRLLASVCRGVQHAHQKGVIHRDLKPSNVLVAEHDGRPVAKIIDFGIAKASGDTASDVTLTAQGQVLGTLEYMSPEQAAGRAGDVDTRSDGYALGVLLFEVLTGTLPYDIRGKSAVEIMRVLETEPVRFPSAAGEKLSPDLEAVIRTALAKAPKDRYESAGGLADDLERVLRGDPVNARAPRAGDLLLALIRRHRMAVVFASTVVGLLIALTVVTSVQLSAQRRERARAEAEAAKAIAVSDFLQGMLESADPTSTGGGEDLRVRDLLDQAALDVEARLADQPAVRAAVENTIGKAYGALAERDLAMHHINEGLLLRRAALGGAHPDVAESLVDLAHVTASGAGDAERFAEADSLVRLALQIDVALHGEEHESVARDLLELGGLAGAAGRQAEAESLIVRAIALRRAAVDGDDLWIAGALGQLAHPVYFQGRAEEAEQHTRRALEIRRAELGDDHALVAASLNDLGFLVGGRDPDEAEALYRESVELNRRMRGPDHPEVGVALSNLGTLQAHNNRLDDAEANLREALAIRTAKFGDDNSVVAINYNNLAYCLQLRGRYAEAEAQYQRAYDIWERTLGAHHPNVDTALLNLAGIAGSRGRYEESRAKAERGLALRRERAAEESFEVAHAHHTLSTALTGVGRYEEAIAEARIAHEGWSAALGEGHPYIAVALQALATPLRLTGRASEAQDLLVEAMRILDDGGALGEGLFPGVAAEMARTYTDQGRFEEAIAVAGRGEQQTSVKPGVGTPHWAECALALGDAYCAAGRGREGLSLIRRASDVYAAVGLADHPRAVLARLRLAGLGGRAAAPEDVRAASHPILSAGERHRTGVL